MESDQTSETVIRCGVMNKRSRGSWSATASYKRQLHRSKLSSTSQTDKAISTRYKANFIVLFLAVLTQLLSTYLFLQLHLTEVKLLTCPTYIPPEYHLLGLPREFVYYLPLRLLFYCQMVRLVFLERPCSVIAWCHSHILKLILVW